MSGQVNFWKREENMLSLGLINCLHGNKSNYLFQFLATPSLNKQKLAGNHGFE